MILTSGKNLLLAEIKLIMSSFHYFHAAENQLKNETGEVCLATIQARLLQCIFLLGKSRVNQACSVLATMVVRIITMLQYIASLKNPSMWRLMSVLLILL